VKIYFLGQTGNSVAPGIRIISARLAIVIIVVVRVGRCCPDGGASDDCRGAHTWAVIAPIIISAASRYGTAAIRYAAATRYGTAAICYAAPSPYSTATNRYGAAAHCASREGFSCNTREA
jgi:hypothetical protein